MNPVPKKSIPRFSESLTRRRRSAWLDVWAARGITLVAAGVGSATVLVFLFICVEAWPALVGQVAEGPTNTEIASGDLDRVPNKSLQRFLGLSPSEFASKTPEQLRLLAEVRAETLAEERGEEQGQGGASVHPTHWRQLILPYAWKGYETPVYLWQPSGAGPRFNLIPLWWGTFKVTVIALVVGVPLAMAAALYVSQVATVRWRLWLKPIIELIAGIPTVVMGFLALGILAPVFQRVVGVPFLLNGMLAGVAVGVAIVPVIFSLAEDALSAVPRDWVRGALALGATPWEAVRRVVLPAAAPGISAAVLLGAAQALGETMIVMMVSGNAPTLGWSVWDPVRTVPVTLAIELGEAARGGPHYRVLFLMGFLLLVLSVVLQGLARGIRTRQARFRGEAIA